VVVVAVVVVVVVVVKVMKALSPGADTAAKTSTVPCLFAGEQ